MIILSVDYGDTRTGIAVCDKTEFLASPVTVITEKESAPLIEKITETVMRDERLTTVSAHNALNVTNTRGKKRKAVVDAVSAVMILQDYLDYRRINHLS